MDKIEQLYNLYLQNGIITSGTSLDMFRTANEQQQNSLYELGKQKNLFQTTDLPTFQSAWTGAMPQPQTAPQPEEVKKKVESDTMELPVAGSLLESQLPQEPVKPQFFQSSLDIITPDLINDVEEVVVPKMNYQFGPMGFKFEPSGVTGDWMVATAPNGKQAEFSLDPFLSESAEDEADKLKQWISANTNTSGLATIENQYKGENKKFQSQQDIDKEIKTINQSTESFKYDVRNYLIDKQSIEKEKEFLDNNASDKSSTAYLVRQSSYNANLEKLKKREQELTQKQNLLQQDSQSLSSAVGKYAMMAEQQGTFGGFLWNKLTEGLSMLAPSVVNVITDIGAQFQDVTPTAWNGPKAEAVLVSEKLGYNPPSIKIETDINGNPILANEQDKAKFNDWYNSLTKEEKNNVESKIRDDISKEVKYGKPGEVGAFKAAQVGYKSTIGSGTTDEYSRKLEDDSFLAGALGGVTKSLPAMIGGGGTIGWVQRGIQMYGQATDAIYNEMADNPEFKDISESEKRAIAMPIGIAEASLEVIGLRNVIANKGLLNRAILAAIGKSGATTTAKTFGELVRNEITSKGLKAGLTLTGAALAEAETGALQQVSEYAFKDIYNAVKEKDMFQTPEFLSKEYFADIGKAAAAEAIGGLILGMPSAVSSAYSKNGYQGMNNQLFNVFEASAKDPEIQRAFVVDLKTRVARGEISLEQARKTLNDYRNSVGLFNSVPENLNTNEKKDAMNLLKEKRDLEQQIEGKDESLTRRQRTRISDINTKLETLSETAATRPISITLPTGNEVQIEREKEGDLNALMSEYNQLSEERNEFEKKSKVGADGLFDVVTNTVDFFNSEQELNDELRKRWEQTDSAARQAEIVNEITALATPAAAPAPATQQAGILSSPEMTLAAIEQLPTEDRINLVFTQEDGTETPVMGNELILSNLYHQAMATPEAERTPAQLDAIDTVQVSLKTQLEQEVQQQAQAQQARPARGKNKGEVFRNTMKSLVSILPGIKVTFHKNETEMKGFAETLGNDVSQQIFGGQNGVIVYDASGKPTNILINEETSDATTLPHEVWHAIFFKAFGDNPQLFNEFRDRTRQILLDNGYNDIVDLLDVFEQTEEYVNSNTQGEEWMVHLGGLLTASDIDATNLSKKSKSLLEQLKGLLNEFAKRITGQPMFLEDATPEDVLDFMVAISDRMSRGESIADFFRNQEETQGAGPRVSPQVAGKTGIEAVEETAKALEGADAMNIFSKYKIQGYGSKFTYSDKIDINRLSDLSYIREWVGNVNPNFDIDYEKNDPEYREVADMQIDWNIKEISSILNGAKNKGYIVGKRIINTDGGPIDIKNIGHSFAVDDSNLPSFGNYNKLQTKSTVRIPFSAINLEATVDRFAYYGNGEYEIVVKPNEKLQLLKYEEVDNNNRYIAKSISEKEISSGSYRIEKQISEAYHKAKEDGNNPELIKAVEQAIGKSQVKQQAGKTGIEENTTRQEFKKIIKEGWRGKRITINGTQYRIDNVSSGFGSPEVTLIDANGNIFYNEQKAFDGRIIKRLPTVSSLSYDLPSEQQVKSQAGKTGIEENPVYFDNAKGFASKSSFDNKIQFKKAVQDLLISYIPELKKKYGKAFDPSKNNKLTKQYLSDIITSEAVKAIEEHPEAIGWYDEKTSAALDVISAIHPEVATDNEARGSFILPLAVMSNGNLVDFNFDLAEKQYDYFKKNGRFNPKGGFGLQQSGIKKSLLLINSLLDNGLTMSDINTFLTSKYRAGDLKVKVDGKVKNLASGELANEMVYGAVILGPKIGNGFYMNLWGQFDQLTMDRWFMRTWGRLTGTLLKIDKNLIAEGKKRVSNALDAIKSDPEALAILKSIVPKLSGVAPADLAKTIEKASMNTDKREKLASNPKTDELRKAGNSLSKNILGEKEAPAGGNERKFIRDVFTDVARRLKEENNIDITMADLQAVLWYPEKILYESFKEGQSFEEASEGYTSESAPDYFNAAKKLATKLGVNETAINQALSTGRERAQRGVGETDTTVGESVSGTNKEVLERVTETIGKYKQGKAKVKSQIQTEGTSLFRTEEGANIGFQYDTDKVARERFNIYRLKKIGSGSDRVVFDLGDGKVLKIAKTARGLEQNIYEGDGYLTIIPNVFERGLNYVVTEKADRLKAADMVPTYNEDGDQIGEARASEMIYELQRFNQKDFDNHRGDLQNVLRKYGLQDIMSYNVLWNDFTAIRNWGYKDGMPLHTDGGTFGGVDMLTSRPSKSLTDPEFREVYNKSKKAKKEFGDNDVYVKFQKSGNTGIEQVRKVAQRYNVNNQGFAPKQVNDAAMKKELAPFGFSVKRARVDEQGRGGGVFIIDGNGRFYNPFRVKSQRISLGAGSVGVGGDVEFGTAFNMQEATAENTVGKEKDLWGKAQVWRERIENAGDILRELSSRGDKPDVGYLMEKVKKLRDWIAQSKKGYTPIDKSIKTIEDFEKTSLRWSDAVDSREYIEKFHSSVLDKIRSEYEAIPTYTKEQRLAVELVLDLINNNIKGLESKLNEIENISNQIKTNGKLPIIADIKLGKAVEQSLKETPKVKSQRISLGAGRFMDDITAIPGYDRMLEEVNAIIVRTKRRGASQERIMKGVMDYVQTSAVYERANDTQREQLVRNVQTEFGKRMKSAPSVGRLLGTIKDIKNITLSEKELLKQQIKSLARGARTATAAWRVASRELANEIKELVLSGKVTTKQVSSVLKRFANVNMFSDDSVDKFVDYMTKVFEDANYAEKIDRARRLLPTAKRNIRTKIGISEAAAPLLQQMFAINPNLIPDAVLDKYLSLVEMFGEKATVLTLADVSTVIATTNEVLDAVDEEVSLAEELAIRFENYPDKVLDNNGDLDYAATLAQMKEQNVITEEDAKLMQKYKSLILPKVQKPEMTEAEIEQEKDRLISVIGSLSVNDSALPTRDERGLAQQLKSLLKPEILKQLTIPQLKNVIKLIDNISNGYLPHYAELTVERLDSFKNSKDLVESVESAKPLSFSKIYSRFKSILTRKNATLEMVRRSPLYYIDQLFGDFKTKKIFDAVFKGVAEAQALFDSEVNKINKTLDNAHEAVNKSFKYDSNKSLMSSFKMMTYMLQLEYESNPNNKEVHPVSKVLNATIKHIDNGKSKYGDRDANMLQEILDKYKNAEGEIDINRLYDSFNPAEKKAIKAIQELNESLRDKAVYTAAVIRGDRINPLNNYVHHYVMHEYAPDNNATGTQTADAYNNSMRPSTRAQSLIERTRVVSPMNFDVFASAQRGAKFVLLDYTMTKPIRTARKTLSQAQIKLEEQGRIPKEQREVFNAIDGAFDEVVRNVLTNNFITDSVVEEAVTFISKTGYRAILASVPRFIAELSSNIGFVVISDPKAFANGMKYKSIVMSPSAVSVLDNVGSKQTTRLFHGDTLSGRLIDRSIISQSSGVKAAAAKNDVANVANAIYNMTLKKYKNAVELLADGLISTPDKIIMRPLWFGSFATEFKSQAGEEVDFDKIAANDEAYMNEHKEAIKNAKDKADERTTLAGATDNAFMGMLKGTSKPNQSSFIKAFNNFNNFMTRFAIYEYTTARQGIYAAMGNGTLSRKEGVALLAAVTVRMTTYTLLSSMLGSGMLSLFADDDEDDEKTFMQKFGQSLASTATGLILGRDFGNATKGLISIGVEEMNKEFLTALREGDYDPYKDAISYSIIPKERKGQKTNLTDFLTQMGGSFGPALKTADLIARKMFEAPKKQEEAIERGKQETQVRIPLEVLGHLGYVPLYKDIRKIVMDQMYKDLENADKKVKDKKQAEKEMLRGYENKTDMKRYNPELYEQVFGEKSPGYDAEQAKKKIEKEKDDLERRRKDEFYEYTPKKTQEESDGFGSKPFGGKAKKESGGFGSKKFGE